MASGTLKAETQYGTWTPQIPRATITNASGTYYKIGRLVVAIGKCTIEASETGNGYIQFEGYANVDFPDGSSASVLRPVFGIWDNGGMNGNVANSSNNNAWIYYQGIRIPLTKLVGTTMRFMLIYAT